jgi:hypothetical protein
MLYCCIVSLYSNIVFKLGNEKKKIENKDEVIKKMKRYKKKDEVIKNDKLKGS